MRFLGVSGLEHGKQLRGVVGKSTVAANWHYYVINFELILNFKNGLYDLVLDFSHWSTTTSCLLTSWFSFFLLLLFESKNHSEHAVFTTQHHDQEIWVVYRPFVRRVYLLELNAI